MTFLHTYSSVNYCNYISIYQKVCTDGLYYIKYDQQVFDTFGTDNITYYRQGILPKPVKHICIPIELLVKIS